MSAGHCHSRAAACLLCSAQSEPGGPKQRKCRGDVEGLVGSAGQ